jgi:shikimate dehydrogenase
VVADIVYNPPETKLLSMALKRGCKVVNGSGMLLGQAAFSFEMFTGQQLPVDYVRQIIES